MDFVNEYIFNEDLLLVSEDGANLLARTYPIAFSITGKTWSLKKFDQEKIAFFKDNYFIDDFTAKLLAIKKIDNKDIKNFLNPSIKNILPNPNILKDMEKATKRTVESIIKKEKIGIFGDYDVDGASSTAILGKFFEQIKNV